MRDGIEKNPTAESSFILRNFLICLLAFLAAGCGSKPVPTWMYSGAARMDSYREAALSGDTSAAELYFYKATESIKKGGDLDLLGKAYLIRAATQVALLDEMDEKQWSDIDAVQAIDSNRAYRDFLKGDIGGVHEGSLPSQYKSLLKSCRTGNTQDIEQAVAGIDDPMSRLIAAGVLVKTNHASEKVLTLAADTAAQQGWKKALLAYLGKLETLYSQKGEAEKASLIHKKILLISS